MNENKAKGIAKTAIAKGLERMKAMQESLILARFEDCFCFETEEEKEAYNIINNAVKEIYEKYLKEELPF